MAAAFSIILLAAGAILYWAVDKTVAGVNLDTVGIIAMIAGGAGLVISLVMMGTERARSARTTVVQATTPVRTASTTVVEESGH